MKTLFGVILIGIFICFDFKEMEPKEAQKRTYLALGDSYTIGESVVEELRWPMQLISRLNENGENYAGPQIIAKTGWTTNELQDAIERAETLEKYDMVSLLIGVNNQFRGYDFDQYEIEFVELLDQAIVFAGGDVKKVFVVSIPDYGVTPFGRKGNPKKIAQELDAYNAYAKTQAAERGVRFYNITPISREAASKEKLVASDNLHPSGVMYTRWVEEVILPDLLGNR